MAYRQNNDHYYNNTTYNYDSHSNYPPNPNAAGHAYSTDMPPTGNAGSYPVQHGGYDYDHDAHWDSKSAKSYQTYSSTAYADSQAHLNPQYEMAEVPPVPTVPYTSQPQYPPVHQQQQLRPPLRSDMSTSGYSSAKEKLMKRRSVRQVELYQGNLVIDVPVPSHIISRSAGPGEEHTKMRYTAATCDPEYVFFHLRNWVNPHQPVPTAILCARSTLFVLISMAARRNFSLL